MKAALPWRFTLLLAPALVSGQAQRLKQVRNKPQAFRDGAGFAQY